MHDHVGSTDSSRARTTAYWVSTALVAGELAVGGVWDVLRIPYVRKVIEGLGYPDYFLVILGTWKLLGAVALLMPRSPRLKEWAYAGAIFTYTGASASHLWVGDARQHAAFTAAFAGLTAASWALRPLDRRDLTVLEPGVGAARRRGFAAVAWRAGSSLTSHQP